MPPADAGGFDALERSLKMLKSQRPDRIEVRVLGHAAPMSDLVRVLDTAHGLSLDGTWIDLSPSADLERACNTI